MSVFNSNIETQFLLFYVYPRAFRLWLQSSVRMLWFRDNDGAVPFDAGNGQVGMDYDIVMAFKSLSVHEAARSSTKCNVLK